MQRSFRLPLLAAALASAFALAACERGSNNTVGQRDSAAGQMNEPARETGGKVAKGASDATITTKINAALAADDKLKATRIDVDTAAGRVTLTGTAPDATSRDRATVLAQAVEGVVAVENKLTVKGG